jgi:hypothetical protein
MNYFQIAERFLQLQPKDSWVDFTRRIHDMVLMPCILCFYFFMGELSMSFAIPVLSNAVKAWDKWIEYNELWFMIQKMRIVTHGMGGPNITTNNPKYMPYVYAHFVETTSSL